MLFHQIDIGLVMDALTKVWSDLVVVGGIKTLNTLGH